MWLSVDLTLSLTNSRRMNKIEYPKFEMESKYDESEIEFIIQLKTSHNGKEYGSQPLRMPIIDKRELQSFMTRVLNDFHNGMAEKINQPK